MAQGDRPDQEPGSTEAPESSTFAPKSRQSLSKLRRELSEEELSSPAAHRLLIEELERLDRLNAELHGYRTRFHTADKRVAVLEEKIKKSLAGEIVFGVTIAMGSAALGVAPFGWSHQPAGWLLLIFAGVLIIGGIVSRVVQR